MRQRAGALPIQIAVHRVGESVNRDRVLSRQIGHREVEGDVRARIVHPGAAGILDDLNHRRQVQDEDRCVVTGPHRTSQIVLCSSRHNVGLTESGSA